MKTPPASSSLLRSTIALAASLAALCHAADVPPETVRADVFAPRVTGSDHDTDPGDGSPRFNIDFTGFPGLDYTVSSTADLTTFRPVTTTDESPNVMSYT